METSNTSSIGSHFNLIIRVLICPTKERRILSAEVKIATNPARLMNSLPTYLADFRERVRLTAVQTTLSHPLPPTQTQRPRACRCFYCSPQLYTHHHPQPKIRPSRRCDCEASFVLHPVSHEPLALARLAIIWFQPVDHSYTREQHTAITEWRSLWTSQFSSLHLPTNPERQLALLRRAYKIFNTLFFCRKLPAVYIDWSRPGIPADASPWMARTATSANALTRTRITFHTGHVGGQHATSLFDTLLHEMIHVYFAHFACADDACVCWQALRENLGDRGHGRAFLWIASAMEEVSERLLGWRAKIWGLADHRREVERGEEHCSLHDVDACWPGAQCRRPGYR